MRRFINWLLFLLALALAAAGAAAQLGRVHAPFPPLAFGAAAAVFALLLIIRLLPLGAGGRSCSWSCWRSSSR